MFGTVTPISIPRPHTTTLMGTLPRLNDEVLPLLLTEPRHRLAGVAR